MVYKKRQGRFDFFNDKGKIKGVYFLVTILLTRNVGEITSNEIY